MKFSISKKVLLPKLAQLSKVVDGKVIPMLSDILFSVYDGVLMMTSGDGTVSMGCTITDLTIAKTGTATIPAKKLHDIVKSMGDTIEIESVGSTFGTKVKSKKSEYKLAGQDPIMYPTQATISGELVVMSGSDFKDMVKRTAYATSTNEKEAVIQGIRFTVKASKLTATACDRHRLAEVAYDLKKGFTDVVAVVKGEAFREFIGIIPDTDITITFSGSQFQIKTDEYNIILRVYDGTYPDTSRLIPTTELTLIDVEVKEFREALERALVIALDDKTNILRMDVRNDDVLITAVTETDKAQEVVESEIKGEALAISFNGKYMIEALKRIENERVQLHLNGTMQPIILRTGKPTDFHLVLPYRTK